MLLVLPGAIRNLDEVVTMLRDFTPPLAVTTIESFKDLPQRVRGMQVLARVLLFAGLPGILMQKFLVRLHCMVRSHDQS